MINDKTDKTDLSVSAAGDDLVKVRVVTHGPEQPVSDHHFQTHETPAKRNAEAGK